MKTTFFYGPNHHLFRNQLAENTLLFSCLMNLVFHYYSSKFFRNICAPNATCLMMCLLRDPSTETHLSLTYLKDREAPTYYAKAFVSGASNPPRCLLVRSLARILPMRPTIPTRPSYRYHSPRKLLPINPVANQNSLPQQPLRSLLQLLKDTKTHSRRSQLYVTYVKQTRFSYHVAAHLELSSNLTPYRGLITLNPDPTTTDPSPSPSTPTPSSSAHLRSLHPSPSPFSALVHTTLHSPQTHHSKPSNNPQYPFTRHQSHRFSHIPRHSTNRQPTPKHEQNNTDQPVEMRMLYSQ